MISIPLDIPDVRVLPTEVTPTGDFVRRSSQRSARWDLFVFAESWRL